MHPLSTWFTRFEVYEKELLSEFSPSSTTYYPPALTVVGKVEFGPHSDRTLERPPLGITPLLGIPNFDQGHPNDDIRDGGWLSEEDEDFFDEWDADYHPLEFEDDSDYGSVGSGSGSSTPASCCWVDAFDWSSPSQEYASAATLPDSLRHGSPSLPSSGPHAAFDPLGLATSQPPSLLSPPIRSAGQRPRLHPYNPLSKTPLITPRIILSSKRRWIGRLRRWRMDWGSG